MSEKSAPSGRLSWARLVAFSGPAIPIAAVGLPISVYLPHFYAEEMGLGLAAVGTVFFFARMWDVVTDPLMGALSDKYPSRWGRRRHWLVLSVPLMLISAYMVFIPTAPVSSFYLVFWMFFLYIGYTMLTISHLAWAAELSDDYNERSRIQGYREAFALIGVPLVLAIPVIIERLGGSNAEADRVHSMGWFILLLLPIAVLFSVGMVHERPVRKGHQAIPVREAIGAMMKNAPLRRLLAADLLSGFSGAGLGSLYLYESDLVWGVKEAQSLLLLLYFIGGVIFIPVVIGISYRVGKHRTVVGAALFNTFFPLVIFLIPHGSVLVAAIVLLFLGLNVGTTATLYRSIMADVSDLDELESGHRRSGLFYSLLTLTQKVGGAIAVGVVFWTLAALGFNPDGAGTSGEGVEALSYVFVALPIICNALVVLVMWGFPIGLKEQQELRARLDERFVEEVETEQHPPFE